MRQLMIILLMTVLLTHCTKLEFDGFDPTTATALRWIDETMMLNKILKYRKGRAPGDQKCFALNTSGGYISAKPSIRAFGDPLVRARKAGI